MPHKVHNPTLQPFPKTPAQALLPCSFFSEVLSGPWQGLPLRSGEGTWAHRSHPSCTRQLHPFPHVPTFPSLKPPNPTCFVRSLGDRAGLRGAVAPHLRATPTGPGAERAREATAMLARFLAGTRSAAPHIPSLPGQSRGQAPPRRGRHTRSLPTQRRPHYGPGATALPLPSPPLLTQTKDSAAALRE